jgi:hypothetical protein
LLAGEQLIKFGKISVPAAAAEADLRNVLLDKFFIVIFNYSISIIWISFNSTLTNQKVFDFEDANLLFYLQNPY